MLERAQVVLIFAAATAPAVAQESGTHCLPYEPDTAAVTGALERRTYPGQPNYESVANGDAPETGYYLRLTKPICTMPDAEPNGARAEVRLVQLVLDSAGYALLRPRLSQSINIRGTLFAAFTGHHHAPLLLTPLPPYGPPRKAPPPLVVGCRDTTTARLRECTRAFTLADDTVATLEARALASLTGVARSRLDAGTLMWRRSRENSCRAESASVTAGPTRDLLEKSCLTRLTRERLRYLRSQLPEAISR